MLQCCAHLEEAMASEDGANRYQVLCYEQVSRLHDVMEGSVPVHGRGNFPTLDIKLKTLVQVVKDKLASDGINVRDIRLNGGAASFILGQDNAGPIYNDLDLIFGVDLSSPKELQKVKNAVLNSLLDFLPEGVNKEKMSSCSLKEAYVQKMVKVCNESDKWSLISLSNNKGRNVELKFVDTMKRQFEFSVDSFQILLDSLLTFYDISAAPIGEHFYPTVVAESMYGHFNQALYHLNNKLIATRNPEEIRGGGLLKYCNLLVREYTPAKDMDIRSLERYMCSRFFIDFSDVANQKVKLEKYLALHFVGDEHLKYNYLQTLYNVVDNSTICLMGHERRQTLNLIHTLASHVYMEQEQRAYAKQLVIQHFDNSNTNLNLNNQYYGGNSPATSPNSSSSSTSSSGNNAMNQMNNFTGSLDQQSNLIIDQVFYGTYTFPIMPYDCAGGNGTNQVVTAATLSAYAPSYAPMPQQNQYYSTYSFPTTYTCPGRCPLCPPQNTPTSQMQCS
jgi:hypothetical protein